MAGGALMADMTSIRPEVEIQDAFAMLVIKNAQ
jgi:hypothetical protein